LRHNQPNFQLVEFASALRGSTIEECEEGIKNGLELLAQALHFYPARIRRSAFGRAHYRIRSHRSILLTALIATYFFLTLADKSGERPSGAVGGQGQTAVSRSTDIFEQEDT
jgi:hypothetical protein